MTRCVPCQVAAAAKAKGTESEVIRFLLAHFGLEGHELIALMEGRRDVELVKVAGVAAAPAEVVVVVEGLLNAPEIFRKPPRVAAPRLVAALVEAGVIGSDEGEAA